MPEPSQMCMLYISDDAFDELLRKAQSTGHVKGSTARGLSDYVEWLLSTCSLSDARPAEVTEQDAAMLAGGYAPEWRMYGPRRRRNVKLSLKALAKASAVCLQLGMAFTPIKRMIGAPTYLDGEQCVSALLEALGTDWLRIEVHTDE